MADVMEEYQSSLEDLTFNSKPHINMLTILAEENKSHAESIVRLIEAQIAKATEKLPLLYLLDSIIKNVGDNYKPLFARNLSSTFKLSFQVADDKSKMSMYKLRTTWDSYFPLKKLHALDNTIKELDPNWPVKALPPHLVNAATKIHVNPKFIKKNETASATVPTKPNASAVASKKPSSDVDKIRQQLVRQQKELLDLQQRKLILELEQTKQELAVKTLEAHKNTKKVQEKVTKDPRSQNTLNTIASLRVTLSNNKVPAATNTHSSSAPKDPRLKQTAQAHKKDSSATAAKPDASKLNASNVKKKAVKSPVKKDKSISPKISPSKSKLAALSAPKPDVTKMSETFNKKSKDKTVENKNVPVSEGKKQKRANRGKSPTDLRPTPPKIPRIGGGGEQSSEMKKKSRMTVVKPEQHRNQRVNRLKLESRDSSRSSESSLSPRFSPEPESDDHLPVDIPPPHSMPFNKRDDGLRRRPSFDPDLHIPKELTLSHQNDILKQADRQLQTGQLTHRQHQELLKQLHQLFEVQRMKKLHTADEHHHNQRQLPLDPRQSRRNRPEKLLSDQRAMSRAVDNQPLNERSRAKKPFNRARDSNRRSPDSPLIQRNHGQFQRSHPPDNLPPNRRPSAHRVLDPRPLGPSNPRKPPPKSQRLMRLAASDLSRDQKEMQYMSRGKKEVPYSSRGGMIENRPRVNRRSDPPSSDVDKHPPNRGSSSRGGFNQRRPHPNYLVKSRDEALDPSSTAPPNASEVDVTELPPGPPLSPPPFFRKHSSSALSESDGAVSSETLSEHEQHKSLRQYALGDSSLPKEMSQPGSSVDLKPEPSFSADEKAGPEEPEDFIIANIPSDESKAPKQLEEPEDYIIAGMQESPDEKKSCEEPEDFIIAQMPPGAEAYHNHSMGLKRNSDSEKAYLDHMKKIKQSMYSKELNKSRKSSQSDSTSTGDDTASEKPASEPPKKEEMRSPSLPPKKRKYFDTGSSKTSEAKKEKLPEGKNSVKKEKIEITAPRKSAEAEKKVESAGDIKTEEITRKSPEKFSEDQDEDKKDKASKPKEEAKSKPKEPKPKLSQRKEPPSSKASENKSLRSKDSEKAKNSFEKRPQKEMQKYSTNDDETSMVYVIEDEDVKQSEKDLDSRSSRRPMKRPFPPHHPPEEWRRNVGFEEGEEARIQKLMQEEQEKLEWEHNLTRKLEMEQWKEDQMRREHRLRGGRGRGRARFPTPGRWESPPRDGREPENLDIARGKIFHRVKNMPRPRLRRPGEDQHPGARMLHPFAPEDDLRIHRRRPLSPGAIPPPGWDLRRPRTPPGRRVHPPPFHDPHEDRLEWERHHGRLPPRDSPFHPDDRRRSPPPSFEPRRAPNNPPVVPPINQVNVNKLLTDLVTMGIIPGSKMPEKSPSPTPVAQVPDVKVSAPAEPPQASPPVEKEPEVSRSVSPFIEEELMVLDPDAELPVVTLTSDLKVRRDEIIKRIYTGIQCSACGLRFTTRQTDLYADHLDWHYRLNRKDKEGSSLTHRELYPSAGDWICFEEIENPLDRAKNSFFEEIDTPDNTQKDDEDLTVPLTGKPGEDVCKVCKEAFETFYNENDDEWQFANCVKVDGDNFHPNCYGDYQDQLTPSTLLSPTNEEPKMKYSIQEDNLVPSDLNQVEIKSDAEDKSSETLLSPTNEEPKMKYSVQEDNLVPSDLNQVEIKSDAEDKSSEDVAELAEAVAPSSLDNTAETKDHDTTSGADDDVVEIAAETVIPTVNPDTTSVVDAAQTDPAQTTAANMDAEQNTNTMEENEDASLKTDVDNSIEAKIDINPQDKSKAEQSVGESPPQISKEGDKLPAVDSIDVDEPKTLEL